MKRYQEVQEIKKVVDRIKKYIKDNKPALLKRKGEDEKRIC